MVKVTSFVFCKNDENFKNKNGLFTPTEIIEVNEERFTLNTVLSVCNYPITEDHSCQLVVKDPQGNQFFSTEEIEIPSETPGDVEMENLFVGFTLGVTFNDLPFRGTGLYSVDVMFDSEPLNSFYIPVTFSKEGE